MHDKISQNFYTENNYKFNFVIYRFFIFPLLWESCRFSVLKKHRKGWSKLGTAIEEFQFSNKVDDYYNPLTILNPLPTPLNITIAWHLCKSYRWCTARRPVPGGYRGEVKRFRPRRAKFMCGCSYLVFKKRFLTAWYSVSFSFKHLIQLLNGKLAQ